MKYFLDSAKLDEIEQAYATFGIDGVTTNPRHIQPTKRVLPGGAWDSDEKIRTLLSAALAEQEKGG